MNRNIYLIFVYLDWLLKFFKFYGGYKMVENNQEISENKKRIENMWMFSYLFIGLIGICKILEKYVGDLNFLIIIFAIFSILTFIVFLFSWFKSRKEPKAKSNLIKKWVHMFF